MGHRLPRTNRSHFRHTKLSLRRELYMIAPLAVRHAGYDAELPAAIWLFFKPRLTLLTAIRQGKMALLHKAYYVRRHTTNWPTTAFSAISRLIQNRNPIRAGSCSAYQE